MWIYLEAVIEPSPCKTIILYFLTTKFRSYCLVKVQVWIIHVDTCRFDDDTPSMQFYTDFASALKQFFLSERMQLYKAINSVKSVFLGFWAMMQSSFHVGKVLANTYLVFCILYTFQRQPLIDNN